MDFFDVNAGFGVSTLAPIKPAETPEVLLEEMDFEGVGEALVFHAAMRDDHPSVGNVLVAEACRANPRLHPAWAILPPQTEELGTVPEFLAAMKEHGVRALRAFPTQHRYGLNCTTFGPLFDEMYARHIPLIVPGEWGMVESLLRDFPYLTVIANQLSNHGQDRYFRPLIERYPNFYVDTSRYECDGGIAAFVRKYGHERMLFGSGFPDQTFFRGVLTLAHADIPDDARAAIAGGNLRRLLQEVKL